MENIDHFSNLNLEHAISGSSSPEASGRFQFLQPVFCSSKWMKIEDAVREACWPDRSI